MIFVEFNVFDVSTKELVWDGPGAWSERVGIVPPGPVDVIDSDICSWDYATRKTSCRIYWRECSTLIRTS